MTPDQKFSTGLPAHNLTEKFSRDVLGIKFPFPSGRLVLRGKDAGWNISNNGDSVSFEQDSSSSPDFLALRDRVGKLVSRYPVLNSIFTLTTPVYADAKPYTICTIPTVSKLNAFSSDLFHNLPLAGIELVQTNDTKETPVATYVNHLMNKQLPVSSDPDLFIHDMLCHWLGAVTTEKKEFDVFKTLITEGDQVREQYGDDIQQSYIARLGLAFDIFSGSGRPAERYTLLHDSLSILGMDYKHLKGESIAVPMPTEILATSKQIAATIQTHNYNLNRNNYYRGINGRLSQAQ
ncbi:MAG TPA: hypothetical protein VNW29_05065 [Candidatus Sulfotelmatobacter sp.]|jgi:hypothetical protein|nr:hypothetical protein [Candidatus Sulfotelmatobacter sp.]